MEIIQILYAVMRGKAIGTWIGEMIYGSGAQDLVDGWNYMKKLLETKDNDFAEKAIKCFERIKSNDKKYICATAYYGLAICYASKSQYNLGYDALNELEKIEITKFTREKDHIRQLQSLVEMTRNKMKQQQTLQMRQLENKSLDVYIAEIKAEVLQQRGLIGEMRERSDEYVQRISIRLDSVMDGVGEAKIAVAQLEESFAEIKDESKREIQLIHNRLDLIENKVCMELMAMKDSLEKNKKRLMGLLYLISMTVLLSITMFVVMMLNFL